MKKALLIATLALSVNLSAQDPPKFLEGISYETETMTYVDDGSTFVGYVIYKRSEYKKMNLLFKKMKNRRSLIHPTGLYVNKTEGKWVVSRHVSLGSPRSFTIYLQ
jgi:hypothetical protein